MKIHFDNVDLGSKTGPNSFAKRLAEELTYLGHQVFLGNGSNCDVSLVFIEESGQPLANKVVQRLDGIWFSPSEFSIKNSKIKRLYESSHHVIWQSEFDRQMTTKFWNTPQNGSVIRNGVPRFTHTNTGVQEQLRAIRQKHELVFVSSANWHPQKRLVDNIRVFHRAKLFHPTACLIVMGSNPQISDTLRVDDVYFAGSMPHEICMQVFRESDWMIHMAWLDHCPNTVVEALSCDVPVICTRDGGTCEIVGEYGVILDETTPYDFSLVDYDNPPSIDIDGQIIKKLPDRTRLGKPQDMSIRRATIEYVSVFEKVLLA